MIDELFPDIGDLPEGISGDELRAAYGGVGGAEARRLLESIDRRIDGLSFFR